MNSGEATGGRRNRLTHTRAELDAIDDAIIAAVAADAPVTVRGVFYRTVSAGVVPKTEHGYKLVGRRLVLLRQAGRVSYADITDGTRFLRHLRSYNSVEEALRDTAEHYRRALWPSQDDAVLIFTEKDAISGILSPVTDEWDVPLGVLRGYSSESFTWLAAERIAGLWDKRVFVYQFGDHDPSGADAWRVFTERVDEFVTDAVGAGRCQIEDLSFERLAVTPEQITEMNLPTRPTKLSDTRAARFAGESVEVDAIPAPQLRQLVRAAITSHIDQRLLAIDRMVERSEREILGRMAGLREEGEDDDG
jgi:hypothetical protein